MNLQQPFRGYVSTAESNVSISMLALNGREVDAV
jgi:hypothetical protein